MTIRMRQYTELDYTYCAQPGEWDLDTISREIEQCHTNTMKAPTKIILWEYQWEWLTRRICNPETVAAYVAAHGALGYKCIYGIPVEVKPS